MLGYALWERRFNRDPTIVPTSLVINDTAHTVVGVLPASFDFATIFAPGSAAGQEIQCVNDQT